MSFGFSAGDFIAAINLIRDVCRALSDVQGARAEFRDALEELRSLEDALENSRNVIMDNLRRKRQLLRVVGRCQALLSKFLLVVKKYQPYLRFGGSGNKFKDLAMKVQWSMFRTEDLRRFRMSLKFHLDAIHIILQTANQSTMRMMHNNGEKHSERILSVPMSATEELELPYQIPLQQPILLEDAFGNRHSLFVETLSGWNELDKLFREIYKDTPGHQKLEFGEFVLQHADTKEYIPRYVDFSKELKPGSHIQMSVIFQYNGKLRNCPKCGERVGQRLVAEWACQSCELNVIYIEDQGNQIDLLTEITSDSSLYEGRRLLMQHCFAFFIQMFECNQRDGFQPDSILDEVDLEEVKGLQEMETLSLDCSIKNFSRVVLCNAEWPSFSELEAYRLSRINRAEAKSLYRQLNEAYDSGKLGSGYFEFGDELLKNYPRRPYSWIVEYQQTIAPMIVKTISLLKQPKHQFHPLISRLRATTWLIFQLMSLGDCLIQHSTHHLCSVKESLVNIDRKSGCQQQDSLAKLKSELKALGLLTILSAEQDFLSKSITEDQLVLIKAFYPKADSVLSLYLSLISPKITLDVLTGGPLTQDPKRFQSLRVASDYPVGTDSYLDPHSPFTSIELDWLPNYLPSIEVSASVTKLRKDLYDILDEGLDDEWEERSQSSSRLSCDLDSDSSIRSFRNTRRRRYPRLATAGLWYAYRRHREGQAAGEEGGIEAWANELKEAAARAAARACVGAGSRADQGGH